LGYDYIPTDHNPVWLALAGTNPFPPDLLAEMIETGQIEPEEAELLTAAAERGAPLAERLQIWRGTTADKKAILTAYVLCQTAFLDTQNGPIRDGSLGTLRQRWYYSKSSDGMGFKLAAQTLEGALIKSADIVLVDDERSWSRAERDGAKRIAFKVSFKKREKASLEAELGRPPRVHIWPKKGWGRVYSQAHSAILADLVRNGLTYEQLWVRDASRDSVTATPLVPDFNGILVLEKQGLFEHFTPIARALGFPILLAMSGNSAFSSVESLISDNLRNWDGTSKVTPEKPLHIFSITDHDYFGHIPVEEGAALQFARYFGDLVQLHRVGVSPELVRSLGRSPIMAGYEFEADYNAATWAWALEHGIWAGQPGNPEARCFGIEVEALEPKEYIPALVEAIVAACGGDEEVRKALAKLAEPEWYEVARRVETAQYSNSRLWRLLHSLGSWAADNQGIIEHPTDTWVHSRIHTATKWVCVECGHETDTDPDTLRHCPGCADRYTWEARADWDGEADDGRGGYRYTCPCGYEYGETDPSERLRCPGCNHDLTRYAEGQEPWKEQDHVQETVAELIAEKQESLDLDDLAQHAETGSYGVWRPVDANDANDAAAELFQDDFENPLARLTQAIDAHGADFIADLEQAFRVLEEWELYDPDD
jgi:rubrerythrin